jgi:hypothetical protein
MRLTVTCHLPYCFTLVVVATLHQPSGSRVVFGTFHLTGGSRLLVVATYRLPCDSIPVTVVTFHLQVFPEPYFQFFN